MTSSTNPHATPPADAPALRLTSPSSIVSAVPHLLGFHPESSIVLVLVRQGLVRLTIRTDIPGSAGRAWARDVVARATAVGAEKSVLIVYPDAVPEDGRAEVLPHAALVRHLRRELRHAGAPTFDSLLVAGGRWWSYECRDLRCCPPEGRAIDTQDSNVTRSELVGIGMGVAPDRRALAEGVRCAEASSDELAEALADAADAMEERIDEGSLEDWREQAIAEVSATLASPAPVAPTSAALMILALYDIRVRDTILWDLAAGAAINDWRTAAASLADVLGQSPRPTAAPVATCLAICFWQIGDGARANEALRLAIDCDPEHRLARLVYQGVQAGIPPWEWVAMMTSMRRDTCRHGDGEAVGAA